RGAAAVTHGPDAAARLVAAGMRAREAEAKAGLHARCVAALDAMRRDVGGAAERAATERAATERPATECAATERAAFFVPGRIEILGKHTDYAGGRSLLCAVERGFVVVAAPRADAAVTVTDARLGETRLLALDPELAVPRGDWGAYVAACVRRVARNFPAARRGASIAFASDLPPASGMSSSSALSTAVFLALDAVNRLADDPRYRAAIPTREALAGYLGTIENGQSFGALAGDLGVGTFGGSEDHTAILCCRSGVVSRYSFAPVRAEGEIALPVDVTFVVAHSGVEAEKGAGAQALYNELSLGAQRILALWNDATGRADPSLAAAVASAPDAPARIRDVVARATPRDFTPERLRERFDQFVLESTDVIPRAAEALARGDLAAFGAQVARSQRGAETMLRNQIPETIALVALAHREGAVAASAFGAGFGGSVWALVRADGAERFAERWAAGYAREFPEAAARAVFLVTGAGPGAMRL
ncbi:MAG TPA: galactokinase family protein, partial [Gemmatimonadaceae bacterium]|nr:galactokinase family protein [Gemmatimonadaceae bacterium]